MEPAKRRARGTFASGLIAKATIVSGMTLVSRILGLVRDIVFARFFGASLVMDAFLVANRIPNMLRRFFAEGAFSQGSMLESCGILLREVEGLTPKTRVLGVRGLGIIRFRAYKV